MQFIWIAIFIVPVWRTLGRDFQRGLCGALALFAAMPSTLAVQPLGDAFEFTFQRILLITVVVYWAGYLSKRKDKMPIPFLGLMTAWWIANLLAFAFALDKTMGLKWMLSFSTEIMLFYIIVGTTITDMDTLMGAFYGFCISAGILAFLGTIEYYTGFNPALDWMGIKELKDDTDIIVTFRHRILFGFSMAMGFPLLLAMAFRVQGRSKQILMTAAVMMAIASCYFSGSRGPWFGAAIAGAVMYVLGTAKVRKSMRIFAMLSLIVVVVRPGVRDTLRDLVMSTFDTDSYRGKSYAYRKELWPVAIKLSKESAVRGLFGHGGLSTETMDLHDMFEYGGSTYHTGFSSWDNNYACDLVEFGYVGLGIEITLYLSILYSLYRANRQAPPEYQDMSAAFLASGVVYCFALTNVFMFSPQLKCMFFTIAVIGARLPELATRKAGELAEGQKPAEEFAESDTVAEAGPA
jgi:hypothetical protein